MQMLVSDIKQPRSVVHELEALNKRLWSRASGSGWTGREGNGSCEETSADGVKVVGRDIT